MPRRRSFEMALQFPGLTTALGAVEQLVQKYERIGKADQQLRQPRSLAQVSSGGGSGPFQRLINARANLSDAIKSGDDTRILDARYRVSQSQTAADRAQERLNGGPDLATRVMRMIDSSRIGLGAGGRFMPLVGQVRGLAFNALGVRSGSGAAGGVTGLLVTGAILAFSAAIKLATKASQELAKQFEAGVRSLANQGRAQTLSGGTPEDMARLRGLGVDPTQVPGLSQQVHDRLSSTDPMAQLARSRLGVPYVSNSPFGSQNHARQLAQVLDGLDKIKDKEEQLRLARALGVESMLDELRVSPDIKRQRKEFLKNTLDPQTARDNVARQKLLAGQVEQLQQRLASRFLPLANGFLDIMNRALGSVEKVGAAFDDILNNILKTLGISKQDDQKAAERAHTDAMKKHADAMNNWQGTFGGGPRTQGSMGPSGLSAEMKRRGWEMGALENAYFYGG